MGIGRPFRKREHADLDARLRADRPEPPDELLQDVVRRLETPKSASSRRPARLAYSLAAAFTLALLVPLASFGALGAFQSNLTNAASSAVDVVTQAVDPGPPITLPGSPPSGEGSDPFIASIGTYQGGSWICHWNGGDYTPASAGTASNWTPIQLTSMAVYNAHVGHTFDIGPNAGFTTPEACAAAAAANSPSVTINQAAGQSDPTGGSPINFTVVFSQNVTDFATGDVTLSGTAGATTATVTGGPATYNVAVSGMTTTGTVIATIQAGVAHNAAGYANFASTSGDNTVTYVPRGLSFTNVSSKNGSEAVSCSGPVTARTCTISTIGSGNGRFVTGAILLIDETGSGVTNTTGGPITVTLSTTSGTLNTTTVTIPNGASTSGTWTNTLPNGGNPVTITASATINGTAVTATLTGTA